MASVSGRNQAQILLKKDHRAGNFVAAYWPLVWQDMPFTTYLHVANYAHKIYGEAACPLDVRVSPTMKLY